MKRTSLGGGQRAVIFVDVTVPVASPAITAFRQRLRFTPVKTINNDLESTLELEPLLLSRAAPVPLGNPLKGGCWIASHALDNASVHRRTLIALGGYVYDAQRFAIDWIRVGADGQAFRGDPAKNANWSAEGADVLAAAAGTVISSRDGIPENDPTSDTKAVPIDLQSVGGNNVLIDIGRGYSLFYAHLQPGSLKVREGDRVREGQLIGRVGNTGQADAPHLHMHVVRGRDPLAAEGVPFEFKSFRLQGHLPSLGVLVNGPGWRPSGRSKEAHREMPVENAVVSFTPPENCPR